jgi:hypothetical protein
MNGASQLPQYTFDPVTKQYTLVTPTDQSRSGLGGLYDATGGGGRMDPLTSGRSFNPMSPGYAQLGVGLQNIGQFAANNPMMAALSPVTTGLTALGGLVGNTMMGTQVSPVANPTAPIEAEITPTENLAAMNAAMAAQQAEAANQASVANTATATAEAIGQASDVGADVGSDAGADGGGGDSGGDGGGDFGGGGDSGGGDGGGGGNEGEREGGMISLKKYAEGGLASAAQNVQSQGRKGDSMLVHMSPNEVRGLQAIAMQHGGSLTINPETGLIEANFLRSILPMIAGAALTATGIGAPMAALLVGGGTSLMTGSLEKGLMAGLGAFGGAGLGSALSAAGAAAPAATGTAQGLAAAGSQAATTAAPQAVMGGAAELASVGQTGSGLTSPVTPTFGQNISQMGSGIKALGTEPGRAAFMQSVGGPMGLATKVGGPLVAGMFSAEEEQKGSKPQTYIRPYSFDYQKASDLDPSFRYRTGERGESTAEQRYFTPAFTPMGVFKAGTEPGPSFYGNPTQEQLALYSRPKDQNVLGLAAGGVAGLGRGGLKDGAFIVPADVVSHLGNGSNDAGQKILRGLGARPIKGKGDGMSDSIPTTIEGRQPALVADGEAYIPPEVVKKIGAKRLYSMMAKIRQARTGTKKQAPEVNPREFMPA